MRGNVVDPASHPDEVYCNHSADCVVMPPRSSPIRGGTKYATDFLRALNVSPKRKRAPERQHRVQ